MDTNSQNLALSSLEPGAQNPRLLPLERFPSLFTENEVVNFVSSWLHFQGYKNIRCKYNKKQGHDIEGEGPDGKMIYVECKGVKSERTGNRFSIDYQYNMAASAVFKQLRLRERDASIDVAIALPDHYRYPELMADLKGFCMRNNIKVFWVSAPDNIWEWQVGCSEPGDGLPQARNQVYQ